MADRVRQSTRQGKVKKYHMKLYCHGNAIASTVLALPQNNALCAILDRLSSCYFLIPVKTLVLPVKCSSSHSGLHRASMHKLSFVTQYFY